MNRIVEPLIIVAMALILTLTIFVVYYTPKVVSTIRGESTVSAKIIQLSSTEIRRFNTGGAAAGWLIGGSTVGLVAGALGTVKEECAMIVVTEEGVKLLWKNQHDTSPCKEKQEGDVLAVKKVEVVETFSDHTIQKEISYPQFKVVNIESP